LPSTDRSPSDATHQPAGTKHQPRTAHQLSGTVLQPSDTLTLRYGVNPHLFPARAEPVIPGRQPLRVVHGTPSACNLLDALAGWHLVREAAGVLGRPAAASIKHLSPAGAAVDGPVDPTMERTFRTAAAGLSAVARAYVRARDTEPQSSYGDLVAVSEPVDRSLAQVLRRVVSDGVIAPDFEDGAVDILAAKKRGRYLVLAADPKFDPPTQEVREVFGLRIVQPYDQRLPHRDHVATAVDGTPVPDHAIADLLLGLIVAKYAQSNSVCFLRDGMTVGVGVGQQSRVACTRIAGAKVDAWCRRREGLDPADLVCVSDGMLAFRDNVDEAVRHGVRWIAEPGGSERPDEVADACREHGVGLVRTGVRLFRH
jgi:phosphoribosylaminoimidazolecarboxamide formyltransferase / IMP cyclohydrolase